MAMNQSADNGSSCHVDVIISHVSNVRDHHIRQIQARTVESNIKKFQNMQTLSRLLSISLTLIWTVHQHSNLQLVCAQGMPLLCMSQCPSQYMEDEL